MKKTTVNATELANRIAELESQLQALKSAVAPVAKVAAKTAKPTTRREAIAQWEAEKGITPEVKANYKALNAEMFEADWAKWTASKAYKALSGAARKEANRKQAAKIRASYAKMAKSF